MASISSLGVGSGLDLSGLLDQLESAERQQLSPIVSQQQSQQAKISSFGLLESALGAFRGAAEQLNDPAFFSTLKSSVSGEAATATAGSDAMPGSYLVDVTQEARGYSIATTGVADREAALGAGTIAISLADGDSIEVEVTAEDSSLEAVRDAINEAGGDVAATIVNDGSAAPHRLVLSSRETGTDSAIAAVDFGALGGSLALDATTEVAARNTELTVNGIAIESQTNTVEGAIQGVTLEIEETGQVSLELRRDDEAISEAVRGFVDGYNALQRTVDALTSFDAETGEAGTLLGNSTLRSVESRLRSAMGAVAGETDPMVLSDLGISLELDGTLSLDSGTFNEMLSTDPGTVADFFAGAGEAAGFAGNIDSVVGTMLGDDGLIGNATSGLENGIEALDRRYERMEQSIATTIERYRSQFSRLDSMIANMNSTSAYLTQQFDIMNAQLGRE